MDLQAQLESFRHEHQAILHSLYVRERALNLVASTDQDSRLIGLTQLRGMDRQLLAVGEHCRAEEQSLDSSFGLYLGDAELRRLRNDHEVLQRWVNDFRWELEFATTPRTDELVRLGRQLLDSLRHHITTEEGLLKQIEEERGTKSAYGRPRGSDCQ